MLITLSGLDGAGKSTLAAWLRAALEDRARPAAVLHMDKDVGVYAYARMLRSGLTRLVRRANGHAPLTPPSEGGVFQTGPRTRIGTITRNVRNAMVWSKIGRRLIYPLDLVVFLCYRAYIEGIQKRVLIMDRYFYDTLVDVSDGRRWTWVRLLKAITPTPTVAVLLDTGPEESYARKGEYSVEYLRDRWAGYHEVFQWVPAAVRLHNGDLAAARATLRAAVLERLEAR